MLKNDKDLKLKKRKEIKLTIMSKAARGNHPLCLYNSKLCCRKMKKKVQSLKKMTKIKSEDNVIMSNPSSEPHLFRGSDIPYISM